MLQDRLGKCLELFNLRFYLLIFEQLANVVYFFPCSLD